MPTVSKISSKAKSSLQGHHNYSFYLEPVNGQSDMDAAFRDQYQEAKQVVERERTYDRWNPMSGTFRGKVDSWCGHPDNKTKCLRVTANSTTSIQTDEEDIGTEIKQLDGCEVEITCVFTRIDTAEGRVREFIIT